MSRRITANVVAGVVTGLLAVTFMFMFSYAAVPASHAPVWASTVTAECR